VRARSKEDGRVQVKVRGGGEAVGELVVPADHLAALGQAVGEVARAFGGRAWTVADARQKHRAAYTPWTEEDDDTNTWPTSLADTDACQGSVRSANAARGGPRMIWTTKAGEPSTAT
jgi:hypothetical protein